METALKRISTYVIGSVYAVRIVFTLVYQAVTNPTRFFSKKDRSIPPSFLVGNSGWTHKFAQLKDVKLHYVEAGTEDGPLMILLHGFPEFWYSWRFQIPEFSKKYRVVAVDLRGYGDSDKPSGVSNYIEDKLMADVKHMIEFLGHNSAIVVGHDWGGAIAWEFAIMYPEFVNRLIVLNCPHPMAFEDHIKKSKSQFFKSWYMFFFQLPYLAELFLSCNDYQGIADAFTDPNVWGAREGTFSDDDIEAFKYTISRPGTLTAAINFYRAVNQSIGKYDEKFRSTKLQMPVCVIFGTKDGALDTEMAIESDKFCLDFTLRLVEGISHWVQQEAPSDVNRHMNTFLETKSG